MQALNDNDFKISIEWLEANNIDYYSYSIAGVFICALEYGDMSGLSEQNIKDFESWQKQLPGNISHFDYLDTDNTNFKKCEICNLGADCITALGIIL